MALISRIVLATSLCFVLVECLPGRQGGGRRGKKGGNNRNRGSKKISNKKGGNNGGGLVTCPGFAGYCSESYPGDTCLVVCAFGRNNVPVCQEDGTWTDEPRCIEHEPGKAEQVPGTCPGVPGYCSLDLPGGLCTFECARGAHIRSSCLPDGTWDPYPTCDGDVRETKDGCDPCPGPFGGPRNRTAEAGGGARNSGGGARNSGGGARNSGGQRKSGGSSRNGASGGSARGHGTSNGGGSRRNGGSSRSSGGSKRNSAQTRKSSGSNRSNNRNKGGSRRNGGGKSGGRRPNNKGSNRKSGGGKSGGCPDSVLEACIDACPGASAQVFGSCVAGCSKRCSR